MGLNRSLQLECWFHHTRIDVHQIIDFSFWVVVGQFLDRSIIETTCTLMEKMFLCVQGPQQVLQNSHITSLIRKTPPRYLEEIDDDLGLHIASPTHAGYSPKTIKFKERRKPPGGRGGLIWQDPHHDRRIRASSAGPGDGKSPPTGQKPGSPPTRHKPGSPEHIAEKRRKRLQKERERAGSPLKPLEFASLPPAEYIRRAPELKEVKVFRLVGGSVLPWSHGIGLIITPQKSHRFSHIFRTCHAHARPPCCIHGRDTLYHTQTCRTSDEKW